MCMIVGKQEGKKGDTVTLKREGSFIFVWKKKKNSFQLVPTDCRVSILLCPNKIKLQLLLILTKRQLAPLSPRFVLVKFEFVGLNFGDLLCVCNFCLQYPRWSHSPYRVLYYYIQTYNIYN